MQSDITLLDERFAHTVPTLLNRDAAAPTRISELLDLSVLLEALVLYDQPVIRVHDAMPSDYMDNDVVLQPFLEAGVLGVERYSNSEIKALLTEPALEDDGKQFRFHLQITVGNAIEASRRGARYVASGVALPAEAERLLRRMIDDEVASPGDGVAGDTSAHLELYVSTLPILRAIGTIATSTDPLLKSYASWNDATQRDLRTLADWGKPIPLILPPVAAIVFEAARELDSVGKIALDLREDLEPYRAKLREYSATIRDEGIPLKDSLEAAQRLQSGVSALTAPRESRSITSIVNLPELAGVGAAWLGGSATGIAASAKAALGKPFERVLAHLKRRDAFFVASLDSRFREIRHYAGNVSRLVGDFEAADYETALRWMREMQVWKAE
jgi:hypothetical protein